MSDNRETLSDAKTGCLHVDAEFHNDVGDNGRKLYDEKSGCTCLFTWAILRNRCVTPKIVDCLLMSTIWRRCMTIEVVSVHVALHMNITNISRAYHK